MVVGRVLVRLTLQQPLESVGVRQRQVDIEMGDSVLICRTERFELLSCECAWRNRETRHKATERQARCCADSHITSIVRPRLIFVVGNTFGWNSSQFGWYASRPRLRALL